MSIKGNTDSIVVRFHSWILYRARNQLTRIASYLRRMMTKLCIKIHMKFDSAIESAFPKVRIGKETLIAA